MGLDSLQVDRSNEQDKVPIEFDGFSLTRMLPAVVDIICRRSSLLRPELFFSFFEIY